MGWTMIGKMAIAKGAWIQRSWTFSDPYFSFQKHILFTMIYTLKKKWTKTERGKLKKIQDFCPWDSESCHLATARCVKLWSLNSNLLFKVTRPIFLGGLPSYFEALWWTIYIVICNNPIRVKFLIVYVYTVEIRSSQQNVAFRTFQ